MCSSRYAWLRLKTLNRIAGRIMALAKRRTKALPLLLLCHDVNGGVNLAAKLKEAATG